MDSEKLMKMVREAFPDGECTSDELHDWLADHVWHVLTQCYGSVRELLEDLPDDTYDYIVSDLVLADEYGDGLAYQLACEELNIVDRREE